MSTGDLHNNFERLRSEAKATRYPHALSFEKISTGDAKFLLPLLDHALVHYRSPFYHLRQNHESLTFPSAAAQLARPRCALDASS